MITCRNCSAQLQDDARFCNICGAKVHEMIPCPSCAKLVNAEYDFCLFCGTRLKATVMPVVPTAMEMVRETSATQETPVVRETSAAQEIPIAQEIVRTASGFTDTAGISAIPGVPESPIAPVDTTAPNQSIALAEPVNQSTPAQKFASAAPQENQVKQQKPAKKDKSVKQLKPGKQKKATEKAEQPVKGRRKWLLLIPALAVVLAAGVFVAFLFLNKGSHMETVVYLKEGNLKLSPLKSLEPIELSEGIIADDRIAQASMKYKLGYEISFSKDGKLVFYPGKKDYDTFDLYYLNLKSKDKEGEKIASKVYDYKINSTGTVVYYKKNNDLYRSDLSDEVKIDSNVIDFYISEDGKKLVYQDEDNNIYYKIGDKDEEKLDSDAELSYISEDFNKIYYMKANTLYLSTDGGEGEKLISDIDMLLKIYDTGEIYYMKTSDTELSLSDFVNDDLLSSDSVLVEPIQPVYPYYEECRPSTPEPIEPDYSDYYDENYWYDWDAYYADYDIYTQEMNTYNTEWDRLYREALEQYDNEYTKYEAAYMEYGLKATRDELRSSLAQNTLSVSSSTLYLYQNGKTTSVSDQFLDYSILAEKIPAIVYQILNKTEITKINMSEVTSVDDVNYFAREAVDSSAQTYVAIGSVSTEIKQTKGENYMFNPSGTALYFIDNYDDGNGYGDLYEAKITDTKVDAPVLYDKEVLLYYIFEESDSLYYFKGRQENSTADLYLNKKRVDDDVLMNYFSPIYSEGKDILYYISDYDDIAETGTLKLYDGSKPVKISDKVHDYYVSNEKSIVYLKDYKTGSSYGDMYLNNGSGKEKRIDKKVSLIVPIYGY